MHGKFKKLATVLMSVIIISFFLNIVIDNPYSNSLVRAAINKYINEKTNISLSFESLSISLVPIQLNLHGVTLKLDRNDKYSQTIDTSHLEATLSIKSLILGKPKLGKLKLTEFNTTILPKLEQVKETNNTESESPNKIQWPPTIDIPIDELELQNATIKFIQKNKNSDFETIANAVDLDIKYNGWEDTQIDFKTRSIDVKTSDQQIFSNSHISLSAHLNESTVDISSLLVKDNNIDIDGTGKLKLNNKESFLHSLDIDQNIAGTIDLSFLGTLLKIKKTKGPVDFRGKFQMNIPFQEQKDEIPYKLFGFAESHNAQIDGFSLDEDKIELKLDHKHLAFPKVEIIKKGISYGTFNGALYFNKSVDYKFDAQLNDMPLTELLATLGVPFDIFDGKLKTPRLAIQGKGDPFSMKISSKLELSQLTDLASDKSTSSFKVAPSCLMDLQLKINSDKLQMSAPDAQCYTPKKQLSTVSFSKIKTQTVPETATNISPLNIGGTIHFDDSGLDLKLKSQDFNLQLAQFFSQTPLKGNAFIETRIHGPYSRVIVDNKVQSIGTEVNNIPLGKISGDVSIVDNVLKWKNIHSYFDEENKTNSHIFSNIGSLSLNNYNIISHIKADKINQKTLDKILSLAGIEKNISLQVNLLEGNVKGNLFKPGQLLGQIKVNANNLTYRDEHIANSASLTVKSTTEKIQGKDIKLNLGSFTAIANIDILRSPKTSQNKNSEQSLLSSLGLDKNSTFEMQVKTFKSNRTLRSKDKANKNLDHLSTLPYISKYMLKSQVRGNIKSEASISGTFDKIQGTFSGQIERFSLLGSPRAPVRFKGFLEDNKVDVTIDHSGNSFKGRMSMDFARDHIPYEWYFNFDQFDIRPVLSKFFYKDPRNFAYFSGDWMLHGNLSNWWESTGELKIDSINAQYIKADGLNNRVVNLNQKEPIKVIQKAHHWYTEGDKPLLLSNSYGYIQVKLPDMHPPENISVHMLSDISLDILKELSTQVESTSGNILADISIDGRIDDIKYKAHVQSKKSDMNTPLSLGIADLRPLFRNIKLDAKLDQGIISIKQLTAQKGNGFISVNGDLNLDPSNNKMTKIAINLDSVSLVTKAPIINVIDTVIGGHLVLKGQNFPYSLTGDVDILKARSTNQFDIREEIITALRENSIDATATDATPNINFTVNFKSNKSVNIRNKNMDITLSSNLLLSGSDIKPRISGVAEVNKGKFIYKQNFKVKRGIIIFDNPVQPDPTLDIVAEAEVSPYKVAINISGRVSDPTVEVTVDPPNREDGTPITNMDALILLSRGRLPTNSNVTESESAGTVTAEAASLLIGQFEQPLEKLFDLSGQSFIKQIYVDFYASQKDGSPVPRANVPLNLGKEVDVVLSTDPDSAGISVEYPLHESISVSGNYRKITSTDESDKDSETDAGLGLKFKFNFP